MMGWAKWAIALAVAGLVVCEAAPVLAASEAAVQVRRLGPPDVEARRDALLRQMIAEPSNLDLAFDYATLSASVGDYEAAISTLERMLIYAPNTPRLQMELGMLYYKIGAYDMARSYFDQALANPSTPPEVAQQIRLYLQQLALAADPPPFYASVFSAIRWESNANSGPGTQNITLQGIDFTLDDQSIGKSGWSNLTIGTLHYTYDLKKQGDRLEFDALFYSTAYFDKNLNDIDLDFLELTLGPSFNMKRWGLDQSRLYLYGIGNLAYLGYDYYFAAPGAGVRLLSINERSVLDARVETRVREFDDTPELPTNSLRDGPQTRAGVTYSYFTTPALMITSQFYVQREDVTADFYSNWEIALSGGFGYTFTNPMWQSQYPWTLQVGGGIVVRDYDAPDPIVDLFEAEEDDIWWGRVALVMPFAETWSVVPQVEYRDQDSNYAIRAFDDLTAMVGLQKRF